MRTYLLVLLLFISYRLAAQEAELKADSVLAHSNINHADYQEIRGGLQNSFYHFSTSKTSRVAFVGGSITEMKGWKEKICKYLTERFPETTFEFIYAGIPSTGSTAGAFRLVNDVLSKGKIDLLFEEASVNDAGQSQTQDIRGMEGIVRRALEVNPMTDVVLMYFVDPKKMDYYNSGQIPPAVEAHNKVAEHYQLPSLNLAKEITDRINANEFTWDGDFKNLHPSPFGHELYFQSMCSWLENCWKAAGTPSEKKAHVIPSQMDPYSFVSGCYVDIRKAKLSNGWRIDKNWSPSDKLPTRKGFVDVPMLISSTPGAEIKFNFKGTAVGFSNVAGPDAGIIEYKIDNGDFKELDLFSKFSTRLYLNQFFVLEDELPAKRHQLIIRVSEKKNEKSKGNTCQIVNFLVNRGK
ncbi:SGNH/GDSL hydrolase family protein [Thermophagus sp. OGC60D27]|uniref:SGNH/GDSL hydrolase family protein n=1 Tax=Thermophagus sp. OGC60D27 TaxID=3458415 RepID=UPI004038038F